MKDVKRLLYVVVCAVFFIGLYILSDFYAGEAVGKYASEISSGNSKLTSNEKVTMDSLSLENQVGNYVSTVSRQEIRLSFLGDITFEGDQLDRYYDSSTESFDFTNSFRYITKYLKASNYVAADFEGVMDGPDENYEDVYDQYGTAGFLYNIPEVAAENMKAAGISLLQTANEHSGDFGIDGVKSTLSHLDSAGIKSVGTQKSSNDKRYTIASVNSLKIGFVAYTNDLNAELDEEDAYAINSLDNYDESKIQQMCNDVRAARRDGAEFIVAMVYAGDAYNTEPDENQKALFNHLFEAGADIVIGTEPYALQPIEIRDLTDTNGTSKKGVAIYSLGTFLGSETYGSAGIDNDIGAIFDVIIDKEGNKKARISGIRLTPTCITYTEDDVFVLPAAEVKNNKDNFSDVTDETVLERVKAACDEIIPGLLEGTGLTGQYSENTYVVNF
ncbi:CapA family protein [Frisingicoccus caecimuris]|uniref:Poly-gamma-glutamate synthesis protein (Capsule biosynthesis protein) n=1 Tax=Frisingicoccus caecimuris TaxID=1796636 RepID=A0A4R2LCZ8_9FIRM|nr:CapA family protein [Frisingicoccus caecimuris]MCR1918677.1 CapA family protein [Frisingicoccus caecimuris]TCO86309.1 poly-gamma-glutamate synthesis protein (capsule biosynthesis protein) [Frisingicoccus caecimuris]